MPQGGTLGETMVSPDAAKTQQGPGGPSPVLTKGRARVMPPGLTEWVRASHSDHLYKQRTGDGPPGAVHRTGGSMEGVGMRQQTAIVRLRLQTIESNPGPETRRGRRRVAEESREARRVGRHRGRRNRREQGSREGARVGEGIVENQVRRDIVTWNLQRVSLRENNRRRLRAIVEFIEGKGWEIVLLSEVSVEAEGVIWLGEEEHKVAIIHGMKSGILLRGVALDRWVQEGQQKWLYDRVTAVVCGGVRLVSVYQPVWGTDAEAMERYRRDVECQVGMCRNERLVIGGDFNASVGKDSEREGVCGRLGLGRANEAGRDLIDWCEEHDLAYVNSFVRHRRRGTWFNRMYGRWYELDGFIVRKAERHRIVKRMRTVNEVTLSDHKPKSMTIKVVEKKWRTAGGRTRRRKVKWEVLRDERKKEEYKVETQRRMDERENGGEESRMKWDELAQVMTESAEEVCGLVSGRVENPWMLGHERRVEELRGEIERAVNERNELTVRVNAVRRLRERRVNNRLERLERELREVKERVKYARRRMRNFLREVERDWWREKVVECENACRDGRIGEMYDILKVIGRKGWKAPASQRITVEQFKEQFESTSAQRYEVEPNVIRQAVEGAHDLRGSVKAREANERMNEDVSREEVVIAMKEMKDSAPGEDGVRLLYIREACEEVKEAVIGMVQFMFEKRADRWNESLKVGLIAPLYKKGDRSVPGNYRGVCLLAMGSRVLARVIAKRLRWWAEHMNLMDESQCGFRSGRSTADVAQIVIRMNEDVCDYRKRRMQEGVNVANEDDRAVARLLDLEKAYPRVSKPGLWMLLERYGLNGKCLESICDLHETTEYRVKGREGMSTAWLPARGLREGCSTSPILFNIYHQAVMRQAGEARVANERDVGVEWKWVPGSTFAGKARWEKGSTEGVSVRISELLFADDTTLVGEWREMESGANEVKEVMNKFEEKNNEGKEEVLEFGSDQANEIRMLGSWVGAEADGKKRIKRASGLWASVKERLKGTYLSKRWQARIVEACVESALLFDCQVRMWWKKDMKRLQSWMDKCYRYVWSDRNGEPLRQMQERHVNMQDVRNRLNVKSVQWKIEKRVLERIGHVMRMGNDRLTKAVTLGWYEKLEGTHKVKGKKRKTVLYWKRVLREAGIDVTDIERLTSDRDGWKRIVHERMSHLEKWERQRAHGYVWGDGEVAVERNVSDYERSLRCRYEGCEKVCKSRAGLTMHEKRIHRVAEERMMFECDRCGLVLQTAGARENHRFSCTGGNQGEGRRECGYCGTWVNKGSYARHVRGCNIRLGREDELGGDREEGVRRRGGVVGPRKECERCGRVLSVANMARHQRSEACRVWDPGGGA